MLLTLIFQNLLSLTLCFCNLTGCKFRGNKYTGLGFQGYVWGIHCVMLSECQCGTGSYIPRVFLRVLQLYLCACCKPCCLSPGIWSGGMKLQRGHTRMVVVGFSGMLALDAWLNRRRKCALQWDESEETPPKISGASARMGPDSQHLLNSSHSDLLWHTSAEQRLNKDLRGLPIKRKWRENASPEIGEPRICYGCSGSLGAPQVSGAFLKSPGTSISSATCQDTTKKPLPLSHAPSGSVGSWPVLGMRFSSCWYPWCEYQNV